jgi:hypothetical protein
VTLGLDKLPALNSATKYPSIETYHVLGERGSLTEEVGPFSEMESGQVIMTEKVDGTNGRIILLPDGDFFIGSREELLYAKGDRVKNLALGIVSTLRPIAQWISGMVGYETDQIRIFFLEVYGGKIGAAAKNYTRQDRSGARLFDTAFVNPAVLDRSLEEISSWRERGGQRWANEDTLMRAADVLGLTLTPRLGTVDVTSLPTSVEGMNEWLEQALPQTQVALDDDLKTPGEGIVFRSHNRKVIAKARFQDYARTLKRRK